MKDTYFTHLYNFNKGCMFYSPAPAPHADKSRQECVSRMKKRFWKAGERIIEKGSVSVFFAPNLLPTANAPNPRYHVSFVAG